MAENQQNSDESFDPPLVANSVEETMGADPHASVLQARELDEDAVLALLHQPDLSAEVLEKLSKTSIAKNRKVRLAIIENPKTPRYVSVALVRQLFTFDLMRVALMPTIPGDIKVAAEDVLIKKLESISSGERLSLARRASGRIAGMLLLDSDQRVMQAALENPRLTEAIVIKALLSASASAGFVRTVTEHPKWSLRRDIRIALLRSEKTPVDAALEFSKMMPTAQVQEILRNSRLPGIAKAAIVGELQKR